MLARTLSIKKFYIDLIRSNSLARTLPIKTRYFELIPSVRLARTLRDKMPFFKLTPYARLSAAFWFIFYRIFRILSPNPLFPDRHTTSVVNTS